MPSPLIILLAGLIAEVTTSASAAPQAVSAQIQKADQLEDADRFTEALALLKEAEKVDANNPEILYRIARVEAELVDDLSDESKKKRYAQESVAYAKRAIESAPKSSNAHLSAAIAYGKLTDYVDNKTKMEYSTVIKKEAEEAVALDPKNDYAYLILARWNFEMTQLNPVLKGIAQLLYGQIPAASQETALEDFQKAIANAPDRIIHHFYYGEALAKLGRKDQAKAEYQKVLQLTAKDKEDRGYQRDASAAMKELGK